MLTRWIIRLIAIVSVLLMGAFADAQTQGGVAAPGGGGGARSSGGGGGGRAPARAPAASPGGGRPTGGSTGSGTSSNSGGTRGTSNGGQTTAPPKAPSNPPTNNPPAGTGSVITKTGPGSTSTGTPITGTGTTITQTPSTGNPNPAIGTIRQPDDRRRGGFRGERRDDAQDNRLDGRGRRHRDPNDPNRFRNAPTYILPQTYGFAPYTWWFNGTNHWFPADWDNVFDGNDGYVERDDDRYDRVAQTPTVPATPTPAPIQPNVEGMPAYSQALVEFKSAQQAYEDASARVLAKLRKDPEYQRLVAQRDRAEDRVEAVQAGAKVPPSVERVAPAAQQKLEVSSKVTKMEQDAIAADPEAAAAKAKMVEANARLSALRKQAETSGGRPQ